MSRERTSSRDHDAIVHDSTGNAFRDLRLPEPEMRLVKTRLAQQIAHLIKSHGLTQQEAAERLGIDQPKVSAILRGRLKDFATDRLMRFIIRLNQDVIISFGSPPNHSQPRVRVLLET